MKISKEDLKRASILFFKILESNIQKRETRLLNNLRGNEKGGKENENEIR